MTTSQEFAKNLIEKIQNRTLYSVYKTQLEEEIEKQLRVEDFLDGDALITLGGHTNTLFQLRVYLKAINEIVDSYASISWEITSRNLAINESELFYSFIFTLSLPEEDIENVQKILKEKKLDQQSFNRNK